ncbi:gamma-glutamyl-gamma-aminobutyrate hydrolase family protein [Mycobacterium sp. AMU20-3851]|uniref:gamma-glutamyl-gamma-aminobutyrate hydrolase family protein n=1 Tax=Mycobacterium sp. AMU20-3851 TaxID=3122055 RepID=UPI00375405E6
MGPKPVIAVTLAGRELPAMVHWRLMFDGLSQCGAIPVAIDCGQTPLDVAALLGQADGLLISGGADVDPRRYGGDPEDPTLRGVNPVRDANEIAAFEAAWARRLPTLAICRGLQLVNVVRGGTLYADLPRDFGTELNHRLGEEALLNSAHQVDVDADSRLAQWMQTSGVVPVNSQHHQGIRTLAAGFTVAARATDGLVEAYESLTHPVTAIQWHPEITWCNDDLARRLLSGFVTSCAAPVPAY